MSSNGIVVIGGGIVGLACARALQREGRQVTVIDPSPPGSGCSFGNAGLVALDHILPLSRPDVLLEIPSMLVHPLSPLRLRWRRLPQLLPWLWQFVLSARPAQVRRGTSALSALLQEAVPAWRRLIKDASLAGLFRHQGALTIFERRASLSAARRDNVLFDRHGVSYEMLDGTQVLAKAPMLTVSPVGGRYLPEAFHTINPFRVAADLAERFVSAGGKLIAKPVREFIVSDDRAVGVKLESEDVLADQFVVSAGVASAALVRQLGLRIPLVAERGYHVMLECPRMASLPPMLFAERGFVVTPMAEGIRAAGTVEFGAGEPHWERAEILKSHVSDLFGLHGLQETSRWFGDRPTLPDYLPIIDHVRRHQNIILAVGHQHLGLSLAAITGEIVCDMAQGRRPAINMESLRSDRFFGSH